MDKKKLAGREGEALAARYLRSRGYEVIGLNWSCRYGEIDIIAKDGAYVVFAEVKLRRDAAFAEAREFVTASKQAKLRSAAAMWLAKTGCELQPRFDVIEVYTAEGGRITHLENAFQ